MPSPLIIPIPPIQIDRAAFAKWLDQLNPEDKCFLPGDCYSCPLVIYLQGLYPDKLVSASETGARIDDIFHEFDAESWEPHFVRLFDTWQHEFVNSAAVRKTLEWLDEEERRNNFPVV